MMSRMRYVRPLATSDAIETGIAGLEARLLSHLESALMVAVRIEQGSADSGLRYHLKDKIFYVMEGTMTVQLGDDIHEVESKSLVFIPAGTANSARNDGPGALSFFEMLVPSPSPAEPIAIAVDSPSDVPAEHLANRPPYVHEVRDADLNELLPGMRGTSLASPETGSEQSSIFYVEVGAGDAGPDTHIHVFDQYYLVLAGQLTVEVALQKHVVDAGSLVLLPAGVPHRQYNNGDTTEKHLAIVSPAPEPGEPVDYKVAFAARDAAAVLTS